MVTGGIGVAFLLVDRGFAEQVDGKGEAVLAQFGQGLGGLSGVLPVVGAAGGVIAQPGHRYSRPKNTPQPTQGIIG